MKKTYIVTATSAEDAVKKIKALRAKDAPMLEPEESNYKKFLSAAKAVLNEVKFDEFATKFNEIQNAIQFKVVSLLDDSTTTGNIWWDFKKLIEQEKDDADLDMIKKNYEEFIKLFEDFLKKYKAAGEKLADAANKKTVINSWVPWFEKAIARAKANLEDNYKAAIAKRDAAAEKANAKKKYNTVK